MRVEVKITSAVQSEKYPIEIGQDLISQFTSIRPLDPYSKVAVLTDENVAEHWLEPLLAQLKSPHLVLPSGESSKSLESLSRIWEFLREAGCDRSSVLINLGGGMVCDIGGFAASTYMRGIDFVQVPTSLLAQVDASIGGKTAINFGELKNLVGCFAQPKAVLVSLNTLSTLPERELRAGMAEVIKHAAILDAGYFASLEELDPKLPPESLEAVVHRSCEIKADVVQQDVHESGLRRVLNFGHTLGHAYESALMGTEAELLHGEAVSVGMVAAAWISRELGCLESEGLPRLEQLIERFRLPIRAPQLVPSNILLQKIAGDKKSCSSGVQWTVLDAIGKARAGQAVAEEVVLGAIDYLNSDLSS